MPIVWGVILSPGIYIQLIIGPPEDETARAFQYVGIAASLLSITKGCGEWWVRSRRGIKDAPLSKTIQASLFFLPHVLFRTTSLAFIGAFLGYFALGPIALAIAIIIGISASVACRGEDVSDTLPLTLAVTIFAPTLYNSSGTSDRALMKRAITIFTLMLLLSLTLIRTLPIMIHPDTIVSTYGLRHLNFRDPTGASQDVLSTVSCK